MAFKINPVRDTLKVPVVGKKSGRSISNLIKIGARGSKLSLYQTGIVAEFLRKNRYEVEIIKIKTAGDIHTNKPIQEISQKGVFVKEIEKQLLKGNIDLAVHSLKDMLTELPQDILVPSVLKRDDPRDVIVSERGWNILNIPKCSRIGTSSMRRKCFLFSMRNDIEIIPIRGNIETRIGKLGKDIDAIVIAYAGIKRMSLKVKFSYLPLEKFPPCPGQGAIAIEMRKNSRFIDIIKKLNDENTLLETSAERLLLKYLGGGCSIPLGTIAKIKNGGITLFASLINLKTMQRKNARAWGKTPEEVAMKVYREIKNG